jgi:hypothetical protein
MTKHSYLFNTRIDSAILYEGKMIHQFTHIFSKPRYWVNKEKAITELTNRETRKVKAKIKKVTKTSKQPPMPKIDLDCNHYRIAWRNIARSKDQRTMICTILPPNVFLGNSLNYIKPLQFNDNGYSKAISSKEMVFLCGMLNSFVVDFVLRTKVSNNANMFYVAELPIPRLNEKDKYHLEIINRVTRIVCTTREFDALRREIGVKTSEMDLIKRDFLIAEINAYAAKVYKLTRAQLEYILSSFWIVDEHLKNEVLRQFDEIK